MGANRSIARERHNSRHLEEDFESSLTIKNRAGVSHVVLGIRHSSAAVATILRDKCGGNARSGLGVNGSDQHKSENLALRHGIWPSAVEEGKLALVMRVQCAFSHIKQLFYLLTLL